MNDADIEEVGSTTTTIEYASQPPTSPSNVSASTLTLATVAFPAYGSQAAKEDILQDLVEKQLSLEDSELILKSFERDVDLDDTRVSYYDGRPMPQLIEGALEPIVSIVFMPGADKVTVNQQEELDMTNEDLDQKTPRWRIHTAGTLLRNFEVESDLSIVQCDNTPEVIARIRKRQSSEATFGLSPNAVAVRAHHDRVVTLDSANVKIVSEHVSDGVDLQATLVEVDQSSLMNLLFNYHKIVHNDGPALIAESTLRILETMIEDTRRLAIRSPILFRMSTRQKIINSKNTRYGVDHGTLFTTITTSRGIKNIISKSAGYFNSLADAGESNDAQKLVRPKFLQMLTVLLSLLNETDLRTIAPFLESTYRIKAARPDIELLILKVLPLMSINPSIFVRDMIVAVEQHPPSRVPTDIAEAWNIFVSRLLHVGGYMLPGYTEQMGQRDHSWVVKFGEQGGIKDSYVFNHLQYNGELRTINEIPSVDLGFHRHAGEVTVLLTNGQRYLIDNFDHQKTTGMIFGNYTVTECEGAKRSYDLNITEVVVNDNLSLAVSKTNKIIGIVNSYFAAPKLRRSFSQGISAAISRLNSRDSTEKSITIPEIRGCGRLTYHEARLADTLLAVAYKVEGKKIARRDLIRHLSTDMRSVRTNLHRIEMEMQRYEAKRVASDDIRKTIVHIRQSLPEIHQCLGYADQHKIRIDSNNAADLSDEPIMQTIYPGNTDAGGVAHWSPYVARLQDPPRNHFSALRISAHQHNVQRLNWINEDVIEIQLAGYPAKFFVSPLRRLSFDDRDSEIQIDDRVALLGQYMVVVAADEDDYYDESSNAHVNNDGYIPYSPSVGATMGGNNDSQQFGGHGQQPNYSSNQYYNNHSRQTQSQNQNHNQFQVGRFVTWLKITGVQRPKSDRRNMNRRAADPAFSDAIFH